MNNQLLEVENFSVSFGHRTVLNNISFTCDSQGMLVVMGPVGSGKSTLLRSLAGINRRSNAISVSGQALYCGEDLLMDTQSDSSDNSQLPAIVAQKAKLLMATVRENIVADLPERASLTQQQQRELAIRLLEDADAAELVPNTDTSVKDLRTGQQRLIALIRVVASNPRLILADEPTSGIDEQDCERILNYLKQQAAKRAVITVLHNQQQAKLLGGKLALLVDGAIVELSETEQFLSAPTTELGKMFVRTGSCCHIADEDTSLYVDEYAAPLTLKPLPAATKSYSSRPKQQANTAANADLVAAANQNNTPSDKQTGAIEASVEPSLAQSKRTAPPCTELSSMLQAIDNRKNAAFGPRNFLWLLPGYLAGTPRPGLTRDTELDLQALARVGITQLISLESEFAATDPELLARHNINGHCVPIADMKAPSLEQALECCQHIAKLIADGEGVAVHCKAGLGRTGTLLVAYLIYQGMTQEKALAYGRSIEPRWVQSQPQEEFLKLFANFITDASENADRTSVQTTTL